MKLKRIFLTINKIVISILLGLLFAGLTLPYAIVITLAGADIWIYMNYDTEWMETATLDEIQDRYGPFHYRTGSEGPEYGYFILGQGLQIHPDMPKDRISIVPLARGFDVYIEDLRPIEKQNDLLYRQLIILTFCILNGSFVTVGYLFGFGVLPVSRKKLTS